MKTLIALLLILFAIQGTAQKNTTGVFNGDTVIITTSSEFIYSPFNPLKRIDVSVIEACMRDNIKSIKKKSDCSFVLKYQNRIIAKGDSIEINLKENSPGYIFSFRIDKKYDVVIQNTFFTIDKPMYFEIEYPEGDMVKGKGYIIQYYRLICQLEVSDNDIELIIK